MIRILPPTADALAEAAALLHSGQLVGMPTETVYGLAGVAFDEGALARIFAAKERPTFDPLILHVVRFPFPGVVDATRMDAEATEVTETLARRFWPGPLTLVLPRDPRVPELATSGLDTVGVRMPAHPVARALLEAVGAPLAAPSANRFGRISPTRAADVVAELGDRIPLVLDGGPSEIGLESTIVAVGPGGVLTLLRPGGVSLEALESVAPVRRVHGAAADGSGPLAPGMLESHYAPSRPVVLLPAPLASLDRQTLAAFLATRAPSGPPAWLLLQEGDAEIQSEAADRTATSGVRVLSEGGDPSEAARNLFRILRGMDAEGDAGWILAEPAEGSTGLLHAINDRLRRASAPRAPGS